MGLQVSPSSSGEQLVEHRAVQNVKRKKSGVECVGSVQYIQCPV